MPGSKIAKNKKAIIIAVALAVLAAIFFIARGARGEAKAEMLLFYIPTCPHCHKAMEFLDKIAPKYPDLKITKYNASTRSGANYYMHYKKKLGFPGDGVPVAIFGDSYELGFGSDADSGARYVSSIETLLNSNLPESK
jgi:glutaredoxin